MILMELTAKRRGCGALRTAFGVAEMAPKVVERNVNFFFGDLVALHGTLVGWKIFRIYSQCVA